MMFSKRSFIVPVVESVTKTCRAHDFDFMGIASGSKGMREYLGLHGASERQSLQYQVCCTPILPRLCIGVAPRTAVQSADLTLTPRKKSCAYMC